MKITRGVVVSFHYTSRDESGREIETTRGEAPMIYLHGYRNILAGLETAMRGHTVGDTMTVELEPRFAYGERVEEAVRRVPIKQLVYRPSPLRTGSVVKIPTQHGPREATVTKVGKFNVDVDTNHPYAGHHVTFDIEVVGVREAIREEISHGHAHRLEDDPR